MVVAVVRVILPVHPVELALKSHNVGVSCAEDVNAETNNKNMTIQEVILVRHAEFKLI